MPKQPTFRGKQGFSGDWWKSGGGAKARTEVTETQAAFIEWLVDPNRAGTQIDLAPILGVNHNTLSVWKKETYFRAAWDKRLQSLNIAPDRVQDVIDAIFAKAIAGDTKAASLYLQYIDRFTPKSVAVVEDRTVRDMSDEDLAEALEADVVHLKSRASGE